MDKYLGISLLHKHFDLKENEKLVEEQKNRTANIFPQSLLQ